MIKKIYFCFLFLSLTASYACSDPLDKIAKKISKASHQIKNKRIAVLPFPYHDGKERVGVKN